MYWINKIGTVNIILIRIIFIKIFEKGNYFSIIEKSANQLILADFLH